MMVQHELLINALKRNAIANNNNNHKNINYSSNNNNNNNSLCRQRCLCCITFAATLIACCIAASCGNANVGNQTVSNQHQQQADESNDLPKLNDLHDETRNLQRRQRTRRFLTFSGGGVVKFVFGLSVPIPMADPQRAVSMFYNVHIQYTPPPRPLYWWSRFNTTTFAARQQQQRQTLPSAAAATETEAEAPQLQHDVMRTLVYGFIEAWLQREHADGAVCLLQAICHVSQLPFSEAAAGGLFAALLNTILTPAEPTLAKYSAAQQAGRHGANCRRTYGACPAAYTQWMERVSYLL